MSATIHFFIRSDRPSPDGSAAIYMRVTFNKKQKPVFPMGYSVPLRKEYKHLTPEQAAAYPAKKTDPSIVIRDELYYWNKEAECAVRGCGNMELINQHLIDEKKRAQDIIFKYQKFNKALSADEFRTVFEKPNVANSFKDYCRHELFERRSHTLSEETLKSYWTIICKLDSYKPGITLNHIDYKFLIEYKNFMLKPIEEGGKGNTERTVNNNMKVIRTMILLAIKNKDFLREHYPFEDYSIEETSKELTTRDFLEPEEISELEKLHNNYVEPDKAWWLLSVEEWKEREEKGIITPGEHQTLKRFLFSCYTGLRFSDMLLLDRTEHIFGKWIEDPKTKEKFYKYYIDIQKMHKTGRALIVPLIDKALALIDLDKPGRVFESISNQKINKHLHILKTKAKLDKKITFHVSRHSFATTCFSYGIPEKVGQQLLGHKNRKFTEIYTHLSQNRIFFEMEKLNKGLNANELLVNEFEQEQDKALQLLPELRQLNDEKLQKVREFIRLIA